MNLMKQIAQELKIKSKQVSDTANLLDDGNTVPFIARYRKEITGELNEEQIRAVQDRLEYLRNLEKRKEEVIRLIAEQDKLTDELKATITAADTLTTIEDLYLPFRPKRQTRATMAKDKGLEPLADIFWQQETQTPAEQLALKYVSVEDDVNSVEEAIAGAQDILAERIADNAKLRQIVRSLTLGRGTIASTVNEEEQMEKFEMYREYTEGISTIPPHRVLALNRGETEGALKVKIMAPEEAVLKRLKREVIHNHQSPFVNLLEETVSDAYKRLIAPSIERETRNHLSENAEKHAIGVFGDNLRNLLLQPPIRGKVILGIDPAYRTGCKLAVIDATGKLLATDTIYPHAPQNHWEAGKSTIKQFIAQYQANLIAIGNGTASRESEQLASEVVAESGKQIAYFIIDEAGASVYSASKLARKELPGLDVSIRGAVSICRRALDPLAELVKIDPKSIGVGMYQHDINQKNLGTALETTVESCVNAVGVDLNTASPALLGYVAGVNSGVANNIVKLREELGTFSSREQLQDVSRLGPKTFEQCAGFLRVRAGQNPLDNTGVHPESYHIATAILARVDSSPEMLKADLAEVVTRLDKLNAQDIAQELGAGVPTVRDIITELKKPGRDPRDEMPQPIFHKEVLSMDKLKPGMILKGTVRNVVDFGAFVDIGVKQDGLVHVSELSYDYVRNPRDYVAVGDIVEVMIKEVDTKRQRIALTMKIK